MSNPGQLKGGYDPRRNLAGRPKGTGKDIRIKLNYDMVQAHAPIMESVLMSLAIEARDGSDKGLKKWYVREVMPYIYGKPKTEIEFGDSTNREDVIDMIKAEFPNSKIRKALEALTEGDIEEVDGEG